MLELVWLIPALPLLGFLILVFAGKRIGEPNAGRLGAAMVGASFLVTVGVFFDLLSQHGEQRSFTQVLFTWLPSGGLKVNAAILADPLSITMALFVTGIGTLIHIYAIGYMHGDERFARFFVYMNLFVFSMLALILGDSFLTMFLGWEGVGACSYLLISFWFERDSAASAGKKAFVVNRVGDFGLMMAMFLIFSKAGSLTYANVFEFAKAGSFTRTAATAACLLLFVGAIGKSAQLPLYVWLPDAMEGPTPVSALIHAATMVTAGVYLMVRIHPLFLVASPNALHIVAWVGALTALFAATIACAQDDIKRVLAYSTMSQLGYMFLAVGVGANTAAIFHMVTHAFFKALMFLGAGSVIHGMHDEQNIKKMGNLRKWMPITFITYLVGWLAIAGIPPFAGFWSKDDILLAAYRDNKVLWLMALFTAILTAYYMSRQFFLVFFGKERFLHDAQTVAAIGPHDSTVRDHPHESPPTMWLPLVALAGLALVGGAINLPFNAKTEFLGKWLESVDLGGRPILAGGALKYGLAAVTVVLGLVGVAIAYNVWLRTNDARAQAALEPALLQRAYGVDSLYSAVIETPGRLLSAWLAFVVDRKIIDGAVNGLGSAVRFAGGKLRRLQTGYVRNYALGIAGGMVLVLAYALARAGIQ